MPSRGAASSRSSRSTTRSSASSSRPSSATSSTSSRSGSPSSRLAYPAPPSPTAPGRPKGHRVLSRPGAQRGSGVAGVKREQPDVVARARQGRQLVDVVVHRQLTDEVAAPQLPAQALPEEGDQLALAPAFRTPTAPPPQ